MAGGEDEPQQVVTHGFVHRSFEIRRGHLLGFELVAEFAMLALEQLVAPQEIDGAMLGRRHQPGARVARDARFRPLLERGDESILRELLGEADIAHHPREPGDQPGGLDPPDGVDGFMNGRRRGGCR
jgi:hypothetical protein